MGASRAAAHNAAMKMEYLANRFMAKKIGRREAAIEIAAEYKEFLKATMAGSPSGPDEMVRVTFALGIGLGAAVTALKKRGPMMVRWIDEEGLNALFMPDGPPKGMGG